jgi:peptidoglycan/LPS O-acetylase OafA/YrhL
MPFPGNNRLVHLDFARGVAALLVCIHHLRLFYFSNYTPTLRLTWFDKVFYCLTGLGHQAVVIFFVLSGFLIGGSVATSVGENRWSWAGYAVRRLTRLWVVLVPALFLTFFWDSIGEWVTHGKGYDRAFYQDLGSGPTAHKPAADGMLPLLGNLGFLQGILCPVYGTNGPLWSLANEFWYYLVFPLGYLAIGGRLAAKARVFYGMFALILAAWLPKGVLLGGVIWLLGYSANLYFKTSKFRRIKTNPFLFILLTGVLLTSLWLALKRERWIADFLVGVSFAGMLPFLASRNVAPVWYRAISAKLSDISYTLYLVHFPILAFFFFAFSLPKKQPPSLVVYLLFVVALASVLGYAAVVWWFFERRTDQVRRAVTRVMLK